MHAVTQPCHEGAGELSKVTNHTCETCHHHVCPLKHGVSSLSMVAAQGADVQRCEASRFDSRKKFLAAFASHRNAADSPDPCLRFSPAMSHAAEISDI